MQLIVVVVAVLYPFAIYFGHGTVSSGVLAAFLAVVLLLRVLFGQFDSVWKWAALVVVLLGLAVYSWLPFNSGALNYYPVAMNSMMFLLFGLSLLRKQPLIEQIARKRGMPVDDYNIGYLRNLTLVWTVFFGFSIIMSTWTVLAGDREIWLLYNGLISYVLIGLLTLGELIFRHFLIKRRERALADVNTE